ncbi:curli production assembly/transport protein CsgE [Shewanella phaeophyticola]|uniref:Curli production assembly/transport component CsgE n=1 Tax=Shewanella phaeophyticola TaxID=2978345 RepID=A0ABT2P380_9GAMM|nr:curli production assembly/transport protein CsgE [Shewanella sp. KJ10-1]MCT8986135.1 curli production assembly/transport protein CsgE [Shewanella sp. KJ10-1]
MKLSTALLAYLLLSSVTFVAEVIAVEQQNTDVNIEKFNKADIPISTDNVKLESSKSKAQESALQNSKQQKVDVSDAKPKREDDLIDGLILNRAMTRFGHRFYREFVSAYRDINGMNNHNGLTVVEQATARSGSKILVLHNRKPIFITFVSPASRSLDAQADVAARRVNDLLLQYQQQSKWSAFSDPDLASDEF